ncbi:phosphodiester glycosidase family protein [Nanoarchaeota archaeon]
MRGKLIPFLLAGITVAPTLSYGYDEINQNSNIETECPTIDVKGVSMYFDQFGKLTINLPQKLKYNQPKLQKFNDINVYEINPRQKRIVSITSDEPKAFGYFIWKAQEDYPNIEAIMTGTFVTNHKNGIPVGKIIENGEVICNGSYGFGEFSTFVYHNEMAFVKDPNDEYNSDYNMAIGGLARLVKNYELFNDAKARGISPFINRPRTAVGIKRDGNIIFVFVNSKIQRLANIMLKEEFDVKDAIVLDGGDSRALWLKNDKYAEKGYIVYRENSNRLMSNVIGIVPYEEVFELE